MVKEPTIPCPNCGALMVEDNDIKVSDSYIVYYYWCKCEHTEVKIRPSFESPKILSGSKEKRWEKVNKQDVDNVDNGNSLVDLAWKDLCEVLEKFDSEISMKVPRESRDDLEKTVKELKVAVYVLMVAEKRSSKQDIGSK